MSRLSDMGWGIFRGIGGVTARTGRGRQDSVRPAAIEITVAVTVVRRRRTRLFCNIKRLIYVNKKSVHLESRCGSDTWRRGQDAIRQDVISQGEKVSALFVFRSCRAIA